MSTYDSLNELTGDANPLEEKPSTFVDMLNFGFCGFQSPDDAGAPSLPFDLGVGFCARDDDDDDALFAGAWESSMRLPGLPPRAEVRAERPGGGHDDASEDPRGEPPDFEGVAPHSPRAERGVEIPLDQQLKAADDARSAFKGRNKYMAACAALLPLQDKLDEGRFKTAVDAGAHHLGPNFLCDFRDPKGRTILWHAVNLNDDLAIAQLLYKGAGASLNRRRGPAKYDCITLAVQRQRPLLADTLLTNASMLQQRKNGKYLLPTLSDLGSADTRAESHRYSSNYEDFKRVDNLKQRKSMVDDVSYLCCECGDRDEHDDGHQFHRDSLVDDEVAPPSSH